MVKKQQQKKTPSKKPPPATSSSNPLPPIDPETLKNQQRILTLFSDAFDPVLSSDSFAATLQSIKQSLFNRDFDAAFGSEENLQAYAARWSPTRALCYASIFEAIASHVDDIAAETTADEASSHNSRLVKKFLCIGGCAAEHIAFASHLQQTASNGILTLLDAGPWGQLVDLLQKQATSPPILSKYASAAIKAANTPLLEDGQLSTAFVQNDVLAMDKEALKELIGSEPLTVTLLFTLNELYTNGGIGKTTKFLKLLGEILPDRSLLLVVDSPGSYSEAAVGKEKKRYPMQWLLDHTLMDVRVASKDYEWEKLESHDSIWFRLPEELSYPIQLENMRYQMHLYQRKSTSTAA
jgi:25S rRNA (uracil2843-N3)-methyltransferase